MITAGDLKHRFKIEINTKTVDEQGGFNSEWSTLGYFWAKVENKSLRSKNEHGEYINTQGMIVHIRQKQRFDINPMRSRDYRLTDKRGNMYSIVNFEQSKFALDFYAISVVQAGHTNEPFAPADNPCAGATQSIQIDSTDGQFDVYVNDVLAVSGGYADIFGFLLFSNAILWQQDGLIISYATDVQSLRFRRTDASTIAFDALDNPTASLSGNMLSFCLSGGEFDSGVLAKQDALVTDVAGGFIAISSDPATCAGAPSASATLAQSQAPAVIEYRLADLMAGNVHRISLSGASGGSLSFTADNDGGVLAARLFNTLGGASSSEVVTLPSINTVMTLTLGETSATISYTGYSVTLAYVSGFELPILPRFGAIFTASSTATNQCAATPMEIRI